MLHKNRIELNNKLINNVGWSFLAKILAMILYFFADIFYARILGVEGYAEWAYFFSICNMTFYIGWFGINLSFKVNISKSDCKESCLGAALPIRCLVSFFVAVLVIVLASPLAIKIGYPYPYKNLKCLLYILSGMVFFNSLTDFFKQMYIGVQAYKNLCIITFVEYFSYGFFSVIFLIICRNPISIAIGYCIGGSVILICNILAVYRKYNTKVIYKNRKNKELQISIIKYAIPLISTSIGGLILTEMDTMMLGIFSIKEQVSLYSIVKMLVSQSVNINMAIWTGTIGSISIITKDNFKEKNRQFEKVNKINIIVSLFICICFVIFGKYAICLVYGNKYGAVGGIIIRLIPYQFLYCVSSLKANFLDFMGCAKRRSIWYISVIVINMVLNYLLIPVYGANGAAIASSISLIPYTLYCIYDVKKIFKNLKKNFP